MSSGGQTQTGQTVSQTTGTTQRDPFGPVKDPIKRLIPQLEEVTALGGGVSGFDPLETEAQQRAVEFARTLPGAGGAIPQVLEAILSGEGAGQGLDFLTSSLSGGNPHLQSIIDITNRNVGDELNRRFSGSGNFGGNINQDVLARALAENESGLRFEDFQNRQDIAGDLVGLGLQIPGLTSDIARSGTAGSDILSLIGGQRRQLAEANRLEDERLLASRAGILRQFADVGGSTSSSGSTTATTFAPEQSKFNQVAGIVGPAAAAGLNFALPGSGTVGGALAQAVAPRIFGET